MCDLLPLVENLHPHERVEDKCGYLVYLSIRLVGEYRIGPEIKEECDNELVNGFSNDHLPHRGTNERR